MAGGLAMSDLFLLTPSQFVGSARMLRWPKVFSAWMIARRTATAIRIWWKLVDALC